MNWSTTHDTERRRNPRFACMLDAQVVRGGQRQRCSTRDISLSGAFLTAKGPAESNTIVRVLVFPGGIEEPIDWMGKVRRLVDVQDVGPTQFPGMALELYAIGEIEGKRWTYLVGDVAQKSKGGVGPPLRRESDASAATKARRLASDIAPIEIAVRDMRALRDLVRRSVVTRRTFIRCREPLAPGLEIGMFVRHPISGETFPMKGRVLHAERSGMAVELLDVSTQWRRLLERFAITGHTPH